jgi:hypothetical protein
MNTRDRLFKKRASLSFVVAAMLATPSRPLLAHANFRNRNTTASLNFEEWSNTPIWRDPETCVAHMSKSFTGTLGDPQISEAGRQFLSDLLVQLTDQQLHDLFDVAHVERRGPDPNHAGLRPATVDEWVAAFERKRDEFVTHRCKS